MAHPAPHRSRVNRRLFEAARPLQGVTTHDLYDAYPDFDVTLEREQALLLAHDVIVLQHPFYWYSMPALLKQWLDLVLDFGWAYGPGGTALRGKTLLTAVTTGAREDAYREEGFNRHTVRQLLAPMDQTAHLCGMRYPPPFVVHATHRLTDDEIDAQATTYTRVLEALRDRRIDFEAVKDWDRLNADLERAVTSEPPALVEAPR